MKKAIKLTVKTKKHKEVVDITEDINRMLEKEKFESGLVFISLLHTTAALTAADLDPGTDLDMLDAFEAIIPKLKYRHPHDPDHVPDHILSSLIGTSLTLPAEDGRLVLGNWQRAVLMEFSGPRDRQIIVSLL